MEWGGNTLYSLGWRVEDGLTLNQGMSQKERHERKLAHRKLRKNEKSMTDLLGSLSVQHSGVPMVYAPFSAVSAIAEASVATDEVVGVTERMHSMEL